MLLSVVFQFSPLREGRPLWSRRRHPWTINFNSRPCVRGDATAQWDGEAGLLFQFSPLREGRQQYFTELSLQSIAV